MRFKHFGFKSRIIKPLNITPKYISIGKNVSIYNDARIEGVTKYNLSCYTPEILIKDGVTIQQGLHLTCAKSIVIGEYTAIAAYVTITDIHHNYLNPDIPVEKQDLMVRKVSIGRGCKINNGAVILPGVTIGNHVTIGANSVVNKDIPSFCVAVGIPAKIVKKYNVQTRKWEKCDKI